MENPFEIIMEKLNRIEVLLQSLNTSEKNQVAEMEIFNLEKTAKYVSLSKGTLYKMTAQREIPHFKRGKKLYFKKSELDEWLTGCRVLTRAEIDKKATDYIVRHTLKGRKF